MKSKVNTLTTSQHAPLTTENNQVEKQPEIACKVVI